MSVSPKVLIAVALIAIAIAAAQTVDAAERGVDRILACADEADDARRLACYDREVTAVRPRVSKTESAGSLAAAAAAQPAAAKPAAAAAAVATEDDFGVEGSEIARQRKIEQEQQHGKAEARNISAKVTEISKQPRGELVLTLDNGQVWVQKKAEPYFPVKVGDAVTINAGMLGSYRLVNGNRSTQVTRIK